jgi:hypothetical protein
MADLFQKLVQSDKQIRAEMNERFSKEKAELQVEWQIAHKVELEEFAIKMERERENALAVLKNINSGQHN